MGRQKINHIFILPTLPVTPSPRHPVTPSTSDLRDFHHYIQ
ncbi:hypothetical protein CWATWH0401_20 [Crocosphaera watsonii WH 0401]|uniref:Uncharacterized protein n=1 Tax=Crocosphaera watsonii WH 0401 TaxID=555881 RepID=T2J7V2_CROWT|nr:hypothetical protein CWATWH0401_20 [Crocosphaera watsonii WH 0401]